jgi:hypothetical protein
MTGLLLLLALCGSYTSTPESFLDSLCSNRHGLEGARFWLSTAWEQPDPPLCDQDSMIAFLEGLQDLSVELGPRELGDVDEVTGQYRVEYPRSIWTWRSSSGKMYRTAGPSAVIWCDGDFYWETLPVIGSEAAGVGITEKFLTAIFFTVFILMFGVLFLVWARRKFGTS